MKRLPVPPLRQSLDRYLAAVAPLSTPEQRLRAAQLVEDFAETDGRACQAELMCWAHRENTAGRSWLSQAWLSQYLSNRAPLPLTSSVGFRIVLPCAGTGASRAADVIHRVADVHLSYLRDELDGEVNARGDAMDMSQWRVLAGGMRHPQRGMDDVREGRPGAASREIGVVWQGRLVMMPVSDEAGRPFSRTVFADAVQRLHELSPLGEDTFTHPSYLGSDRAAAYLDAFLEHPGNREVYDRLVHAVFVVNLTDTPANEQDHQQRVTFAPGQAWAYKPLTYQVSLVDDYVGVHVEHSVVDGATLKSMVALMQDVEPTDGDGPAIPLQPLAWSMSDDLSTRLARDMAWYRRQAEALRVRIVRCPVPVPPDLPFRVSHDALQQLSLLYAQLTAYTTVRSTYEAVDMREYQAGRTECLRPVTSDAVALIRALLAGEATVDHLHAGLAAHREQVISCKSGQGFDRHMLGLRLTAPHLGVDASLFEDATYAHLTRDFLSTTSVGDAAQVRRFSFAPSSVGGFGVNYTVVDDTHEFCVTYNVADVERPDDFIRALGAGVSALGQLLAHARDS